MQRAKGVLISYVSRRQNGRGKKRRRWRTLVSSFGTQEKVANKNGVVDVKRQGDRIILVKLVLRDVVLNIISAYAPQVGLGESEKRKFWEDLDGMVRAVTTNEKLFIGGDLNGHVGSTNVVMSWLGGFRYGSKN